MNISTSTTAPLWMKFLAVFAMLFGALTLFSGAGTLFFSKAALEAAGNYVPFVLWYNFLAGFLYIVAGAGLFLHKRFGLNLSLVLAAATLLVFVALGVHIAGGGLYENRTLGAMVLRTGVWIGIALLALKVWNKQQKQS